MTTKKIALIILVVGLLMGSVAFLSGGVKNIAWIDGKPVALDESNGGNLITVDETFNSFTDIDIRIDTLDNVTIKEGDTFSVKGQNYEDNGGLRATLDGTKLIVDSSTTNTITIVNFGFANISNLRPKCDVVITYPKGSSLGNVLIDVDLSDVEIDGMNAKDINLKISTGDGVANGIVADSLNAIVDLGGLNISNSQIVDLDLDMDTGDTELEEVKAQNTVIDADLGDIVFSNVDLGNADISASTGSITGDGFRAIDLNVDIDLGDVEITNAILEGDSEIDADTGSVDIDLAMDKSDFNLDFDAEWGDISVNNETVKGYSHEGSAGASHTLKVIVSLGDINLKFK